MLMRNANQRPGAEQIRRRFQSAAAGIGGDGPGAVRRRRCRAGWAIGLAGAAAVWIGLGGGAVRGEPPASAIPGLEPAPAAKAGGENPSLYPDAEGRARITMFGLTGVGYKFVYVLDRSASMGGSGEVALRAVKAELRKSLEPLDTVHQFQIIVYNEKPLIFNPSGVPGRLAFASRANKDRAARFIESITADGNTRHDDALKLAIKLRPDVIFLLTDGDDPKLTRRELDAIQRMAGGITIHAIEFGMGDPPAEPSFLATLAAENGGKYAYVDLSRANAPAKPASR